VSSQQGQELYNQYGERYRAPAGDEIGALTGIEWKGSKRFRAVAEPTRRGGGSAMVVTPSP
jgi:gamma-glutamyltranspeptidase / glutathione hydrolase